MNVIYDIAEIRLSEVHTQDVCLPRWEIPVLQVLHGDSLKVISQVIVERSIPNPSDEFQRLATRYGPKNEDVPAVGAVYGQFGPGVTALRNEMRDSLTEADATPSTYRSPDERKAEAEAAADESGQSLVEEAKAGFDAKAEAAVQKPAEVAAATAAGALPAGGLLADMSAAKAEPGDIEDLI